MYNLINIYGDSHCRIFFKDILQKNTQGIMINKYKLKV